MPSDPSRLYAPPVEDRPPIEDTDALARDHRRIVRLHLGAWAAMLLLAVLGAAALDFELWSPEATLAVEKYTRAVESHSVLGVATLLGPIAGIAGLMIVPGRLQRVGFRGQWLAYVGLALWMSGALLLLVLDEPWVVGFIGNVWGIAALVVGLACLAAMILFELATSRARWSEAPLLLCGVGLGAVLQLLALARSALEFFGPRVDIDTLGSGLTYLLPLTFPVVLGIGGDLLERVGGRRPPRWIAMTLISLFAITPWLPPLPGTRAPAMLAVPIAIVCTLVWWLLGRDRGAPRILAAVLAMLFAIIASSMTNFVEPLSVDIHLHDTYFVTAHVHFAGAAALLLVLALLFDRPDLGLGGIPRTVLGSAGLVVLALGLAVAFFAHANLGQSGMPRRYYTYLPDFGPMFQVSILASLVAGVGLLLVVVALVAARRRE